MITITTRYGGKVHAASSPTVSGTMCGVWLHAQALHYEIKSPVDCGKCAKKVAKRNG